MDALFALLVAGLVLARWLAQLALEELNCRHLRARASSVPGPVRGAGDEPACPQSVRYALAKSRLNRWADSLEAALLLGALFSGVLARAFAWWSARWGTSVWAGAAFVFLVGLGWNAAHLPLAWLAQFRVEQQFGFNTTTPGLWWRDRLKGALLALVLGYPLLVLGLKLYHWAGATWWLWAWGGLLGCQLLLTLLAPVLILPLFNKFTPLPAGALRDRLRALAERTHFRARAIQVMDGSKRSRHSNAFFIGLGRFRRIVLFDTLLQQLSDAELEAVLAHEIGHYRLHHVGRLVGLAAGISLAGCYALAVLARQESFYRAFGFAPGNPAAAVLLLGLLGGVVLFWLSPLLHAWARRQEYAADAFAARTLGGAQPLLSALRKLEEKNLVNLTPHPLYSAFYDSHPTLPERARALTAEGAG